MKNILHVLIVFVCFAASCRQQEQIKAKIFERRELKGNLLMIKYEYMVNHTLYTGSATIANLVLNSDTISVIVDPENPRKSIPYIKR